MKVLFVGDLNEWTREFQRYKSFIDSGFETKALTSVPVMENSYAYRASFIEKVMWQLRLPMDITSINKQIRSHINTKKYDIVWIEKGVRIKPSSLKFIKDTSPDTTTISCAEDNMFIRQNCSLYYKYGLRFYDMVFTTKVFNVEELHSIGARRVVLFLDSYDEALFKPMKLSEDDYAKYQADVGFIGTFEKERAEYMYYLAVNGVKVRIYGNGWEKWKRRHNNLIIKGIPVIYKEYVKAINATKINLCFLRKISSDVITSRSMEIPACGAFMLAERTDRHLSHFLENEEAVFFSTKKELLEKVKNFLDNNERKKIASSGRLRCQRSGYSSQAQFTNMLEEVMQYKKKKIN